jgi:hypothetical protein
MASKWYLKQIGFQIKTHLTENNIMADEKTLTLKGSVINGVDQGGEMNATIEEGYDEVSESCPEGVEVSIVDRNAQYVRGSVTTQSVTTAIALLTGTLGTYEFFERKSGFAAATGWIKHVLNNPVIWDIEISMQQGSYWTATFKFECRFATASAVISDVHVITDSQADPTLSDELELGGQRFVTTVLGALAIYGMKSFQFHIALTLTKSCAGAAMGYSSVDSELGGAGGKCDGSIVFQDSSIATAKMKAAQLLLAARASLVLTCAMSAGAANKVITVAGVMFTTQSTRMSGDRTKYAETTMNYRVSNSLATPLTIAGANKIITLADAA